MTETIRVTCLLDRYWDPSEMTYAGTQKTGTLIDISTQTDEEKAGNMIPVGIVLLDDNTFQSVPLEFITQQTTNV